MVEVLTLQELLILVRERRKIKFKDLAAHPV